MISKLTEIAPNDCKIWYVRAIIFAKGTAKRFAIVPAMPNLKMT
jgi:hypothetical protein